MNGNGAKIGNGLQILAVGSAANLLTLVSGELAPLAMAAGFSLTALGLVMAALGDKKFWIPTAVLAVNAIPVSIGRVMLAQETAGALLGVLSVLLSTVVIYLVCRTAVPWLKGDKSLEKRGGWAWQCNAAAVLVGLSVVLMAPVPGEQAQYLRGILNLMDLAVSLIGVILYVSFLWSAGAAAKDTGAPGGRLR